MFYYFNCPRLDFALIFAALWLISDIAIAFVSPTGLPHFLIALGALPAPAPPRAVARAFAEAG